MAYSEQLGITLPYPEWVMQGINPHIFKDEKEGGGDLTFYQTQDEQMFSNLENAQKHVLENFWDPAEIDLPQIIKDLEGTNVKDFGAIPNYLLDNNADLMDSSTWDPDAVDPSRYYGSPGDATKSMSVQYDTPEEIIDWIDRRTAGYGNPEKGKARLLKKFGLSHEPGPWNEFNPGQGFGFKEGHKFPLIHENVNILDYLASQGNPELKRGSSTGFFPTKSYPEAGIWGLRKILEEGKLFEKYTDTDSGARYTPWLDQIGFDYNDVIGNLTGEMNRKKLNEYAGHEAIHMSMYPVQRGKMALKSQLPYPADYLKQDRWQKSVGHPAMMYLDNLFFPNQRQGVGVSKKGWENVKAIMNWSPDNVSEYSPTQGGFDPGLQQPEYSVPPVQNYTAPDRPVQNYTAPDRGDWGPGLHLARGGIASLR